MRSLFCLPAFFIICVVAAEAKQEQGDTVVDPRDHQSYATTQIGDAVWFAENLNYPAPGSFCQNDDAKLCDEHGRLYPWEIALSACPPGWHLSTELEWQMLEFALGMSVTELQGSNARGTDEGAKMEVGGGSGLELKYSGYRAPDGEYRRFNEAAALWTATEADYYHAWHRDIRGSRETSWRSRVHKPYAMSVRCVKNRYEPE